MSPIYEKSFVGVTDEPLGSAWAGNVASIEKRFEGKFKIPQAMHFVNSANSVYESARFEVDNACFFVKLENRSPHCRPVIFCNLQFQSSSWEVAADLVFKILPTDSSKPPLIHEVRSFTFNKEKTCYWNDSFSMDSIYKANEDLGFVNTASDELEIEVTIDLLRHVGMKHRIITVFPESRTTFADVTLDVSGTEIHVPSQLLAGYSRYFFELFYTEPHARFVDPSNVMLKGNVDEFKELLRVIYPEQKPVAAETVESLLKLSKEYVVPAVRNKCIDYLIATSEKTVAQKLLIGSKYQLTEVIEYCLKELEDKSFMAFDKLMSSPEYRELIGVDAASGGRLLPLLLEKLHRMTLKDTGVEENGPQHEKQPPAK